MATSPDFKISMISAVLAGAGVLRRAVGTTQIDNAVVTKTNVKDLRSGDVFIAYRGVSYDGHSAIGGALTAGAGCIVLEDEAYVEHCGDRPYALVTNSREAWAWLAARECGDPQESLTFAGVTGTNGKTSTVWIFKELLKACGETCLTIGTIGAWLGDRRLPTVHTTPDPPELFKFLAEAKKAGVRFVAMEVSSHALIQNKLGPIRFDAAAFTSFSRDHLDFHRTMSAYLDAKWRLFTDYLRSQNALSVISLDVCHPHLLKKEMPHQLSRVGLAGEWNKSKSLRTGDVKISIEAMTKEGSTLTLEKRDEPRSGQVPFFGDYAVKNFAMALALVEHLLKKPIEESLWSYVKPVPGRLEPVAGTGPGTPAVFVDYAHTPDALEKTLRLVKSLCLGRLWVVFGCGGERDQGKRPEMGKIASELADEIVVTSDNPRREDAAAIIDDIVAGIPADKGKAFHKLIDRTEAIGLAIRSASPNDTVLIAGKGHEDYQIIGTERFPFDDRVIAARFTARDEG